MTKQSLPTVKADRDGLGAPTIMDRELAARYGAPYVHLAVFAIDVDRVRGLVEEDAEAERDLPFGWEVFLTEVYLLRWLDLEDEPDHLLLVDVCSSLVRTPVRGEEPPLGAQLPFAVYDAVRRGATPQTLAALFRGWGTRADDLVRELAPLWDDPEPHVAALAELCLDTPLDPPLAEPTARALDELHDASVAPEEE